MYIYTRVDPCIKCTRSKLDSGQVAAGLADSKDFLIVCWFDLRDLRGCLALPYLALSWVCCQLAWNQLRVSLAWRYLPWLVWSGFRLPCLSPCCGFAPGLILAWPPPSAVMGRSWALLGRSWRRLGLSGQAHGVQDSASFERYAGSGSMNGSPCLGGSWGFHTAAVATDSC